MKFKNKLFLSLGSTLAVVAPIATVVACNETKDVPVTTTEQRELWSKSSKIIETTYQEKLISEVSKTHKEFGDLTPETLKDFDKFMSNAALKSFVKNFITVNIYMNENFLSAFGDKLLHVHQDPNDDKSPFWQRKDILDAGFYDHFFKNSDAVEAKTKLLQDANFDKFFKIIWNQNINNFRNSVYRFIISSYYLDTNKANWKSVFITPAGATGKIQDVEGSLKDDNFVLGQKVVRAKLAYSWKATLSDEASKAWAGQTMKEADLNTAISKTTSGYGIIAKDETLTAQRSIVPSFFADANAGVATSAITAKSIWELVKLNTDVIGFAGIASRSDLASDQYKIKQVTDTTKYDQLYYGFMDKEKKELVNSKDATKDNDDIKLTTPTQAKVDVEKTLMIMPQYVNGELSLDFLKDSNTTDAFSTLKNILYINGANDIYTEAINYYSSTYNDEFKNTVDGKEVKGIRLDILDESLRKVAIDSFGFKFIEQDKYK